MSADLATGDHVFIGSTGSYTTVYASRFNGFDVPVVRHVSHGYHPNGSVAATVGRCGQLSGHDRLNTAVTMGTLSATEGLSHGLWGVSDGLDRTLV